MQIIRKPFVVKVVAAIICLMLVMSLFDPGLTSQIMGFGSGNYSGIGDTSHMIFSIGDFVVREEDTGIIIIALFIMSLIVIYPLYSLCKKWFKSEKANK